MVSLATFETLFGCHPTAEPSRLNGWLNGSSIGSSASEFVEPSVRIVEGDRTAARVFIIAAPGAVGKSTYAKTLSSRTGAAFVNLAETDILGGNFFVGGMVNAFGVSGLQRFKEGQLPLVVDALDEAQLRSGPEGYEDGLRDLSNLIREDGVSPVALFGRSSAAFDALYILQTNGINCCSCEINYFDEPQASEYLIKRLQLVASRNARSAAAYDKHGPQFQKLARDTRALLKDTQDGSNPRFCGYAPVLDAVAAYAVEEDLNPAASLANLHATGPIQLLVRISDAVLLREQQKLKNQFVMDHPLEEGANLYTPSEQLARLASLVTHCPPPDVQLPLDFEAKQAYERMVEEFLPQHPFLDGTGRPANAAFAASIFKSALRNPLSRPFARAELQKSNRYLSGILFDLFVDDLPNQTIDGEERQVVELEDVGILFQSLSAQAKQDDFSELEIIGDSDGSVVDVTFDLQDRALSSPTRSITFSSPKDGTLDFRHQISHVNISAPISVSIGDGSIISCAAPVSIEAELLELSGREFKVFRGVGSNAGTSESDHSVFLFAQEALASRVEKISVPPGVDFRVSFPSGDSHPWSPYYTRRPVPPNPHVDILRRRARRILTAFRSHSKGALVRLAAKIDHARMMKRDEFGPRLVKKLIDDGILMTFDAGKFYELNPQALASKLKMDYKAIQTQQWTIESDQYFEDIR